MEAAVSQPVSMALIGAGQRGMYAYGPFAETAPSELHFVAVAEPILADQAEILTPESWRGSGVRGDSTCG